MIAVVDAGPLYAIADLDDVDHARCINVLSQPSLQLVIPILVIAEVTYFVGKRLGSDAEQRFLAGLTEFDIEAPLAEDWPRIAELVKKYSDFPLGGTDASVITLAERLETSLVVTLDRRHFSAVRPRHCEALEILPDAVNIGPQ
ncbi:MAG: type II toxin-antitoxin system VapC family toxin [Candidatus Dormibacteraceae bacterium]